MEKHLPPSIFTAQFLRKPTFRVWVLYRYFSSGASIDISGFASRDV
jgi:hypothetical protein